MAQQRAWSEDDDAYLRRSYGFRPIRMIADDLGSTFGQVQGRARRLGLNATPLSERSKRASGYGIPSLPRLKFLETVE